MTRGGRNFTILPLRREGKEVGLIHLVVGEGIVVDFTLLRECLVPLVMKF